MAVVLCPNYNRQCRSVWYVCVIALIPQLCRLLILHRKSACASKRKQGRRRSSLPAHPHLLPLKANQYWWQMVRVTSPYKKSKEKQSSPSYLLEVSLPGFCVPSLVAVLDQALLCVITWSLDCCLPQWEMWRALGLVCYGLSALLQVQHSTCFLLPLLGVKQDSAHTTFYNCISSPQRV